MTGGKIWSTVVDYFLIMGAIVGVGFASGKEIGVFFFNFSGGSIFGILAFCLLYFYLFFIVQYLRKKLALNSYNEFNAFVFGKFCKLTNIVLVINFSITSAGMLAGADYLFSSFFNLPKIVVPVTLTAITFFLILGGIKRIKFTANLIVPILIFVIIINSIKNININNVNLEITSKNIYMAVYFGLLFGVNNFVAAMPVLFETKQKVASRCAVILSIGLIILLNVLVLSSNKVSTDMPMFELSKNVSNSFYIIYFCALILALFSTLVICSYNMQNIICKNKKSKFASLLIVLFNLILSNVGYSFIVQYLYVVSGIISGIYVLILIVLIIFKLVKIKFNKTKNNED